MKVDIRGTGGIIVAPPSVRRSDPYKGQPYAFIKGHWSDLKDLPPIKSGSLIRDERKPTGTLHTVETGTRNDRLFSRLMREARHCDDLETLKDVALTLNGDIPEPLPETEALRVAESAWKYEEGGKNWCGSGGVVPIQTDVFDLLATNPDAFLLLALLKKNHTGLHPTFAVAPHAMADAGLIAAWGHCRYRKAKDALVDAGLLICTHPGGRGKRDPSIYRLA